MVLFLATSLSCYQCGIGIQPVCKVDPDPDNLKSCPADENNYCVFANGSYSKARIFCLFKKSTKNIF